MEIDKSFNGIAKKHKKKAKISKIIAKFLTWNTIPINRFLKFIKSRYMNSHVFYNIFSSKSCR